MDNKGKEFMNSIVKYNKAILFIIKIVILIVTTIILLSGERNINNKITNLMTFSFVLAFLGILILVLLEINRFINKKADAHFCPKCKATTQHNRFGVCKTCYLDTATNNVFMIFCFLAIMFVCFVSTKQYEPIICYIIYIGIIATFLYPIYMYPAKLARRTEHVAATAIFILNLLFGFTIVFWIVLLIWASNGHGGKKDVIVQQSPQSVADGNALEKISSLKQMLDSGLISQEDFDKKKDDILSKL